MTVPIRVSGFTIVRNGVKFDYPFLESIRSLLPLVDEFWVGVGLPASGEKDDGTLAAIQSLATDPAAAGKLFWFESDWQLGDPNRLRSGHVLSEQTNLALDRCSGDWCIYLQADEVLHEMDFPMIRASLQEAHRRGLTDSIDALVFDYLHFYGSYDVVQQSRSAYRREVRAIRRSSGARSVGDAQSFRLADGGKPRAIRANGARVFHYGWVRTPEAMREKTFAMDELYHGKSHGAEGTATGDNYRYKRFWGLRRFSGSHPAVMHHRIATKNWNWDLERSPYAWNFADAKKILSDGFERMTGIRPFEYRSYRLVR